MPATADAPHRVKLGHSSPLPDKGVGANRLLMSVTPLVQGGLSGATPAEGEESPRLLSTPVWRGSVKHHTPAETQSNHCHRPTGVAVT